MSVLVIVPVLNRPHRVQPLMESLRATAPDADVMFVTSPGDTAELDAIGFYATDALLVEHGRDPGPGDYAMKINAAARGAIASDRWGWVFTGADDLTFHDGWLDRALAKAVSSGKQVIGTNDLWNPSVRAGSHSTHTLVAVDYVRDVGGGWDGPGVLLHEGYDHQCVDNELVTAAKMRDQWAFAKDSVVEHLHPFAKKSPMDSTYEKALAHGRRDIAVFQQRWRNANAQAKARRPRP